MAIASLVLGIIALALACFGSFVAPAWIGLIMGIVGIILACLAKKNQPSGIATGGFVCSLIAVILNAIVAVSCTICYGCATCGAYSLF